MEIYERLSRFFGVLKVPKETFLRLSALMITFIVGLLLRLQPVLRYGVNHRAYDPFVQYLATRILLEKGLYGMLAYYDFKFWYPYGNGLSALYIVVPILGAIIYSLLNFLGIHVDLLTAITITPAIIGALTILVTYFIGKEIKNSNVGLIASILTAVSPGYIQRSIAGFYDNEMTIFFLLLALLFFIRSIKYGRAFDVLLCGFFSGIVMWSWGIWRYLVAIYVIYIFVRLISGTVDEKDRLTLITILPMMVGMGIMIPRNYHILTKIEVFLALAIMILLFLDYLAIILAKAYGKTRIYMYKIFVVSGLVVVAIGIPILLATGKLTPITGKFASVLNPFLREEIVTYTSVAENQPGVWANFYLAVGPGILLIPPALLAMIERRTKIDFILFLLVATSFYFAASITRYIVLGAPILAIAVGLGVDYLLSPYARFFSGRFILHKARIVRRYLGERRIPKGEALGVYLIIFLTLSISVIQGITISSFYSGYDYTDAERAIFDYLRKYARQTDVVLAWWDYGYRCTIVANVTTLADNGTGNWTQMGVVGSMLMLPPDRSIVLMRMYNVRWILIYSDDLAKAIWMIKIASKHAPMYGVHENEYLNEKELRYKEPFFHSVLWVTLAYGEGATADNWVKNYGESKLKDKASEFRVENLTYFVLIMKKTYGNRFVKLYRVIWPEDLEYTASLPPIFNATTLLNTTNKAK